MPITFFVPCHVKSCCHVLPYAILSHGLKTVDPITLHDKISVFGMAIHGTRHAHDLKNMPIRLHGTQMAKNAMYMALCHAV